MKRAREVEIRQEVEEIAKEARSTNDEGNPIHEPFIVAVFGAADALFEIIKERPILMLNLLQTNKALESFWNRFENLWILLTDVLIEKEMGSYAAEVYPFFVVQRNRLGVYANQQRDNHKSNFIGKRVSTHRWEFALEYVYSYNEIPNLQKDHRFYISFFDLFSTIYVALARQSSLFLSSEEDRLDALPLTREWGAHPLLQEYLRLVDIEWKPDSMTEFVDKDKNPISVGYDCFIFVGDDNAASILSSYNTSGVPDIISQLEKIINHKETEDRFVFVRDYVFESYKDTKKQLTKLQNLIAEGVRPEKPELIKLDKNVARPYRYLLYDKEQGMYKTQEEQKAFFIDVLSTFSQEIIRDDLIKDYGQSHFQCAACREKTGMIDIERNEAFCSDLCHRFATLLCSHNKSS